MQLMKGYHSLDVLLSCLEQEDTDLKHFASTKW